MLGKRTLQVPDFPEDTFRRIKGLTAEQYKALTKTMGSQAWRLNNLYKIIVHDDGENFDGERILTLAWAQKGPNTPLSLIHI